MIEFQSVSKTYRDGTTAVDNLDLQIPSDKITVIVGPSGCGKTTTLRMINRMLEPSKGKILWDGDPLKSKRKTSLRRQMGYVIQNGGLFPHRTVVDNVTTVPGLLGWDKAKSRTRALELLRAVGLEPKLNTRYPAQLSGGQQQRVGVARALAADPIVLLMDEPFSAVDPVVRNDLHDLLLGLQKELSKTIVMITHDIDEAIKLGDQVAILRVGGRLAQVGTPQQLLDEPADSFVEGFVGRDRGYRALSFSPAAGLTLDRVRVVRDPASAEGDGPVLVVDGDGRPHGWVDRNRPGQLLGLGSTFDPDVDTLRVALDSALTSPVGLAVAVSSDTGRYAGTVSAAAILTDVTRSRADIAEQISGRQQGSVAISADEHQPDQVDDHQHDHQDDQEHQDEGRLSADHTEASVPEQNIDPNSHENSDQDPGHGPGYESGESEGPQPGDGHVEPLENTERSAAELDHASAHVPENGSESTGERQHDQVEALDPTTDHPDGSAGSESSGAEPDTPTLVRAPGATAADDETGHLRGDGGEASEWRDPHRQDGAAS